MEPVISYYINDEPIYSLIGCSEDWGNVEWECWHHNCKVLGIDPEIVKVD